MTDLTIVLAIIAIGVAIVGVLIAFLTLRRTPKPKPEEPLFIPTCTTILGASMNRDVTIEIG
ncbi:hypothetical protein [Novosphingobium percolationis]|uniref:hypothetical protein n=1 Tax=Novosphingobium percolationis TaxID=2871811 RepID=UPI001CD5E84C|nr:hypothetical protein [Novosphingobium percolationis]